VESASRLWSVRIAAVVLLVALLGASSSVWAPSSVSAAANHGTSVALAPLDATPTATDALGAATPATTVTATPTATPALPTLGSVVTGPTPPALSASEAELFDVTTGKTLLTLSADKSVPMASTTKIMTAVVALTYGKLDQMITVGPDAYAIEFDGTSVAGLRLGEQLSLKELLYGLMLPSGDDAAIAIADGVGGSQAHFVALMNLEAGLLGLSHTHYANPHGLDAPGHYTSASDLVRLTEFAMQSPTFAKIVATPSKILPATATHHTFNLVNTNELLPTQPFAYPGAIGIKTGYTGGAGYCLVFMAKRPSGTLIGVTLGEPTYNGRFTDATAMLNWGYQVLSPTPTVTPGATPSVSPSGTATTTATAPSTTTATATTTP